MTATPTDEPLPSSSSPDPSDPIPGEPELAVEPTRLDRYGSFANVWAAYDPQLDRRVALKLLPGAASSSPRPKRSHGCRTPTSSRCTTCSATPMACSS